MPMRCEFEEKRDSSRRIRGMVQRFLTCAGRSVRKSERGRKSRPGPFGMTNNKNVRRQGGLDVGGAVAVEAGGGDGLGEDDMLSV